MAPDRRPTSAKRTDPMFKRPANHYGRSLEPVTPYQRVAKVWDDRIGSASVQAKIWRFAVFGALLISVGLAGGLVWQAARGTITPWVVEVDKLGAARAVAAADGDYRPTDPQIAFHLARFIEHFRSIPADPVVLRADWLSAYDFASATGAQALNDYARTNDPFAEVGNFQGAGDVSSVISSEEHTSELQ